MKIIDRLLKYISINTTSDNSKKDTPSSDGQKILAELLIKELKEMKIESVYYDEKNCYVYALLKGNKNLPKIGFVSHLDVAKDFSMAHIKPEVINNYNGKDIILKSKTISTKTYPDLKRHKGKTIITSRSNTILGADNKVGITEVMHMIEHFASSKQTHGDIYICFNPDEEIGLGTKHLNKKYFNPDFAYAVDGGAIGEFSYENFNAALAHIKIKGTQTHYGFGKGVAVNAIRLATRVEAMLPDETPENTEKYEGFFYLKQMNGNIIEASITYQICDFNNKNFEKRKKIISKIVDNLNRKYNCIDLKIEDLFYNKDKELIKQKKIIKRTLSAIRKTKIKPKIVPHRGCTDAADITSLNIPCFTIGTGVHNYHSIYEYVCLEDIEKAAIILIEIVKEFSK